MRRSPSRRGATALTDPPVADDGRERIRPDPPAPLPDEGLSEEQYRALHVGYWGEPSLDTLPDDKEVARRRWVFTHPDHPSNQRGPEPPQIGEPLPTIEPPPPSGQRARDVAVASADDRQPAEVIAFPGAKAPSRGRKKKEGDATLRVEYVKPSKNTWCFCIRWTEADGRRPVVYASRVNDKLFKSITGRKSTYAAFKKSLIASYLARAVRQSDGTLSSSDRFV